MSSTLAGLAMLSMAFASVRRGKSGAMDYLRRGKSFDAMVKEIHQWKLGGGNPVFYVESLLMTFPDDELVEGKLPANAKRRYKKLLELARRMRDAKPREGKSKYITVGGKRRKVVFTKPRRRK